MIQPQSQIVWTSDWIIQTLSRVARSQRLVALFPACPPHRDPGGGGVEEVLQGIGQLRGRGFGEVPAVLRVAAPVAGGARLANPAEEVFHERRIDVHSSLDLREGLVSRRLLTAFQQA